jgi:hypothetical protein
MKALVLAAAVAATVVLSSDALAGAARDTRQPADIDSTPTTVIADAGRLSPASLTSMNSATHWKPASRQAADDFDSLSEQIDLGTLAIGLVVVALAVVRPIGHALRRREQQRRATALASSLGQAKRG